jgi:hypothetical protein
MLAIAESLARPKPSISIVPDGTGRVFLLHFPALRTGLLSLSPSGTSPRRTTLRPYVDADGQLQTESGFALPTRSNVGERFCQIRAQIFDLFYTD